MSEVFRFITFQPPHPSQIPGVDIADERSEFQRGLLAALNEEHPLAAVKSHAQPFLNTPNYISRLADLATPLMKFAQELKLANPCNMVCKKYLKHGVNPL